ncbi:LuxR C-terminal-related transcriptional regulator [Roseateles sp.]|uniref:LuxR C-terminal-related transcriptional regulator n=1 Tax=Roseateles sp. TaxID=1971397 RepID=UPI003D096500
MTSTADPALRFEPFVHVDEALWRQRVIDRLLNAAPSSARLTLLSAPAGFGKTTVLAQLADYTRGEGSVVAWLNCDERDKDPVLFAENLQAALGRCKLSQSASPSGPSASSALRLAELREPLLICLDDYECASSVAVDAIVEELVLAAPANVSIVLASREAPHQHLTRLQLAGKVRLVDAELLRFTRVESVQLLSDALPEAAAQQVAAYADGWPFALQLARLRVSGGAATTDWTVDAQAKIPRRQIFDYLAEEVLATLPAELLEFLGDVAVLDIVDVASANALRGRDDSLALIQQLARIKPIAVVDESSWSARLHPLLRDYLIDAAELISPGRMASLHLRAARHLAERGQLHEAVAHAVAGGRLDMGADLIEAAGGFLLVANEGAVRSRLLLQQLPEATIRKRPRLRLLQLVLQVLEADPASAALEFERLEQQIRAADTGADDPARFDLEVSRCMMQMNPAEHNLRFSPWSVLDQARRLARAHAGQDQRPLGCTVPIEIFFLHRYGPVERCERRIREVEAVFASGAYTYNSPWIWVYHARSALARGDLAQAERDIRQSLQQDANFLNFRQGSLSRLVSSLLGHIARLRGETEVALEHFSAMVPWGPTRLLEVLHAGHIETALCEFALGHADRAMELLEVARHLAFEESLAHLEVLAGAAQVQLLARLGDLDGAQALAARIKLDELWVLAQEPFALPWISVEGLAQASFFLQMGHGDAAAADSTATALLGLAKRTGHRLGELHAHLMAARAREALGNAGAAQRALLHVLVLGTYTGAIQPCLDFGAELITQVRSWLSTASAADSSPELLWAQALVNTWEQRFRSRALGDADSPLTPREVDVLCELAKDHTTKLIAKNLLLSPETVKHHLKAIFSKLNVRTREDAILEARRRTLMP